MRVDKALKEGAKILSSIAERPRLEAEILTAFYLNEDRSKLLLRDREEIDNPDSLFELFYRRERGEPIEYIIQEVSFYSESFFISKGALIPRPETEILVDLASEIIESKKIKKVAEVGVGSGIISIILAKKHPDIAITATDISAEALEIAKKNISRFKLQDRIELFHSSILNNIDKDFDLIVSNPPYIDKSAELSITVKDYEPHSALFADDRGTALLKEIVIQARDRNIPFAICEMGYDQREPMERFFKNLRISKYSFYKDLAGLDRGFMVEFKN